MRSKIISRSVAETISLGARLGKHLKPGDLVALIGIFGAGKTYFTKGIARGLGIKNTKRIISPSFVLCNIYQGKKTRLYHFDVQRLKDPSEILKLDLAEALQDGVCVIEWADRCLPFINMPNLIRVIFRLKGDNERLLQLRWKNNRLRNRREKSKLIKQI